MDGGRNQVLLGLAGDVDEWNTQRQTYLRSPGTSDVVSVLTTSEVCDLR